MALIIPAYNEETVIAHTIQSAIDAGMEARNIFVVDDFSNDKTASIARSLVGSKNVLTVDRSGKGLAVHKIATKLQLPVRYRWIHIADADGEFDKRYFKELRRNLRVKYAAATGYVTSLDGGMISSYRAFEYAIGMDIVRRFQALTGLITIIPGPTSIFRSDVFQKLNFNDNALCEDFDVTLQIHRQKLGKIQFIPSAVARTQDPATFKEFIRQIKRWNRGVLQMFFKHHIGQRAKKVDFYLMYQVAQNLLLGVIIAVWVPYILLTTGNVAYAETLFLADIAILLGMVFFAALRTGRGDIVLAFPAIYVLRWVSLFIFFRCFIEVVVFEKYRYTTGVWETVDRRKQKKAQDSLSG